MTEKTLTIDRSRGSKGGGGWDARDDSEDSDEVYSDRQDSDDSDSDNRALKTSLQDTMVHHGPCAITRMSSYSLFLGMVPFHVILLRLMSSYLMSSISRNPITFDEFLFNEFHFT